MIQEPARTAVRNAATPTAAGSYFGDHKGNDMTNKNFDNSGSPSPGNYRPGKDGRNPEIYLDGAWRQTCSPGTADFNGNIEAIEVENYQGGTLTVWGIKLKPEGGPHAH